MQDSIGFLGLGHLGLPMATHLLDAGYPLRVFNRTVDKAAPLVARGAQLATGPADVATPGGVVVSVVWDDAALEAVVRDGLPERLGAGGVHVAMSTVLPATSRRLAALHAQHGATYVEAPIFGRPEAAAARQLWIPIAGPAAAKARVRPILEAMGAQGIFDFGDEVGAANVVKLVGNMLIISAARSLHEGLTLAEKAGCDPAQVLAMLTETLFSAPIYRNYGKMIVAKAPTMATSSIPQKDLGLFCQTAAEVGAPAPTASFLAELVRG